MANQSRILLILKYLYNSTDAAHDVSSKDIARMLESNGITSHDRRTIETDIDMLISAGHDICKVHRNGVPTRYRVVERDFDTVELKILIDAVVASRFISPQRSSEIIQRLASMASIADREGLCADVENLVSIKSAIGSNLYIAGDLYRAIVSKRKVQYQMIDYSIPDMKQIPHRDGHVYIVSPYAMVWKNDRYYLIAHEEDRDMIITPRVDRIREVKMLEEQICAMPEDFDIGHFYSLSHKMYSGKECEVTLLCKNELINHVIDRFGTSFECISADNNTFKAIVRTSIEPTFFGWLFQYSGQMKLIEPQEAVDQYNRHRRKTLKSPKD